MQVRLVSSVKDNPIERGASVLFAALCLSLLGACERDTRPNVVWISLDTLRADHLSCYGYPRPSSPAIDGLAAEGVLFEEAYSTTSWTLPAHVSMLTGLPVSAHGICDHQLWMYVDEGFELRGTFVSETLQEAGYETAGFYNWKYLEPQFGFGPGFDLWERTSHTFNSVPEVRASWEAARESKDMQAMADLMRGHPELFDPGRPSSQVSVDRAIDWLDGRPRGRRARPFFLFLHLFDVHDPYTPPEPWSASFSDLAYTGSIDGHGLSTPNSPVRPGMAPADLEQLIALYDGEIAWVDSQVARVLERLAQLGLEQNTLVILTSDHGEEFFEHGRKLHRSSLYREQVEVPLIVRMPGRLPAGARVSEPVSLIDLVPTVHALLDLPPPTRLPGVDLSSLVVEPRTLLSELTVMLDIEHPEWMISLRRRGESVIVHDPGSEEARAVRFDLRTNPLEQGDGEPIEWDSDAGRELLLELEQVRGELRAARDGAASRRVRNRLTEADRIELQALGYTGSTSAAPIRAADRERLCMDGCVWLRTH